MRSSNLVNAPIIIYAGLLIHKIEDRKYYTLHLNSADLMSNMKSMIWANLNHQSQANYKINRLEELHEALEGDNFVLLAAIWEEYTRGDEMFERTTVSLAIS